MDENAMQYFEEASSFIQSGLTTNRSVLVHCAEGKSRSATFTLAYLLKCEQWDLKKAVDHLSSISNININDGFKQQLMEFEKLLGRDTPVHNFFSGRRSPLKTSREIPNQASKKILSSVELSTVSQPLDTLMADHHTMETIVKETKAEPLSISPTTSIPPMGEPVAISDIKPVVQPPTQIIKAIPVVALPKIVESEDGSDPMFWGSTSNGETSNNTSLDSLGTDEKVLDDWLNVVIL
jgi:hypothetical protein